MNSVAPRRQSKSMKGGCASYKPSPQTTNLRKPIWLRYRRKKAAGVKPAGLGDITPLAAPPPIVRMMLGASANAPDLSIERDVVGMILGGNGGDRGQVDLDGLLPFVQPIR